MPRILATQTIRQYAREAAGPDQVIRQKKVDRILKSFSEKLNEIKSKISVEKFEEAKILSTNEFKSNLKKAIVLENADERSNAIAEIADNYDKLFAFEPVKTETVTTIGGRSGSVRFSTKAETKDISRLMAFLEKGYLKPDKFIPVDKEDGEDGENKKGPCYPKRYRVSVKKPPKESFEGGIGTLSSGFLSYLREQGKIELANYEDWLKHKSVEDNEENKNKYGHLLAEAERSYKIDSWKSRYCKTQDIPLPGIHRGHRLLKLSIPLSKEAFRDNGCDCKIYEGPSGRLATPDLDYDELLRRYVLSLKTSMRYIYNLEELNEDVIRQYADSKTNLYNQRTLERFIIATPVVLDHASFKNRVTNYGEAGAHGFGPPPDTFGGWLNSFFARSIKNTVLNSWGVISSGEQVSQVSQSLISVSAFVSRLSNLCLPRRGSSGIIEQYVSSPGRFYVAIPYENQSSADALFNYIKYEADDIARQYDLLWKRAKQNLGSAGLWSERESSIPLSGFEMKSYIYILAAYNLIATGVNNRDGAVRMLLEDSLVQPFNTESIPEITWVTDGGNVYLNRPDDEEISWDKMVNSYKNALDAVTSFMGADITPSSSVVISEESDQDALYKAWVDLFVQFLGDHVIGQSTVTDNFFVLRLAPRKGRYGEVPQRSPADRFQSQSKRQLSPRHPTRRTESYELEPVPDKYFWYDNPTVYVREDYKYSTVHRSFGIGSNLYSFSLLPEEEQKIVMKSVKDTKQMVSESTAENILEEAGSETESDFSQEVTRESEQESSSQESGEISSKASASFGFGSAEISGSYSSASSSRNMARNVSNVSDRLANKLSAKRKVTIDTKRSEDTSIELHEEVNTERTIKNPNKGHTITFNWYQMTRKLATTLDLEDLHLVYTSGMHNPVRVFAKGDLPIIDDATKMNALQDLAVEMPSDVARYMPPNSVVILVTDPYTEVVPMGAANAFLARVFEDKIATEISSNIYQITGLGPSAPEGLGVAAFSEGRNNPKKWKHFVNLYSDDPSKDLKPTPIEPPGPGGQSPNEELISEISVIADEVIVDSIPKNDAKPIYLPNIDLRFKQSGDLPLTRYQAGSEDAQALPRLLLSRDLVVNTNGVFCDAMIGRCNALEPYLTMNRDVDLLKQKLETGFKEHELKWILAKDGLDLDLVEEDGKITALVKEKEPGKGFEKRKELETLRIDEDKEIATARLKKSKLEKEIALLEKEIEQAGHPPDYKLDLPNVKNMEIKTELVLPKTEE